MSGQLLITKQQGFISWSCPKSSLALIYIKLYLLIPVILLGSNTPSEIFFVDLKLLVKVKSKHFGLKFVSVLAKQFSFSFSVTNDKLMFGHFLFLWFFRKYPQTSPYTSSQSIGFSLRDCINYKACFSQFLSCLSGQFNFLIPLLLFFISQFISKSVISPIALSQGSLKLLLTSSRMSCKFLISVSVSFVVSMMFLIKYALLDLLQIIPKNYLTPIFPSSFAQLSKSPSNSSYDTSNFKHSLKLVLSQFFVIWPFEWKFQALNIFITFALCSYFFLRASLTFLILILALSLIFLFCVFIFVSQPDKLVLLLTLMSIFFHELVFPDCYGINKSPLSWEDWVLCLKLDIPCKGILVLLFCI